MDERQDNAAQRADAEDQVQPDLDQLNECARTALDLARREAVALGAAALCTEHLLIGLASTPDGAAKRVLDELALDAERVRAAVRFIAGLDDLSSPANVSIPFSPRVNLVLVLAAKDAAKRGNHEIGTLNLLSGLLRERAGIANLLLETPGVGLEHAGRTLSQAHREGWRDG